MKTATIVTSRGTLTLELYDTEAPATVANFEQLANSGYYDGTKFHRVIPGFVVQGGDPYSKGGELAKGPVGTGGPGWKIKCETAGNPHKHLLGSLSMAHAGKDTGGASAGGTRPTSVFHAATHAGMGPSCATGRRHRSERRRRIATRTGQAPHSPGD